MKKILLTALALVALAVLVVHLSGCTGIEHAAIAVGSSAAVAGGGYAIYKSFNPIIEAVLQAAGYEAAVLGLKTLPPDTARTVAQDTILACQDSIKYLNTGTLPTADIVNQIVSAKFSNLPPSVVAMIQQAAATLGQNEPSASVYLTPEEIGDIVAFVTGIQNGATAYLADNTVTVKAKYTAPKTVQKARLKVSRTGAAPWFYAAKK